MKSGIRQLHLGDAEKGLSLVAAHLRFTPSDISSETGIQFELCFDGFDYMEAALIRSDGGRQFGLFRYQHSPVRNYTALVIHEKAEDLTEAVNDALQTLGLNTADVIIFHPEYRFASS